MWRREVIRIVIALNWCIAALSMWWGIPLHHGGWSVTVGQLVANERIDRGEDQFGKDAQEWEAIESRRETYRQRTEAVYHFGSAGWWLAFGASTGTAVLLMIAFPKKPAA